LYSECPILIYLCRVFNCNVNRYLLCILTLIKKFQNPGSPFIVLRVYTLLYCLILTQRIEEIYLSSNLIKQIEGYMPWVINLDISNNRIETFQNLKQMKKLYHLNLFNNNISYLAPFAFTSLDNTELITIDINANCLGRLVKNTFSNLINLKYVNLDFNRIETIESFAFYNLSKLNMISLRNNQIKKIENFAFQLMLNKGNLDNTLDLVNNKEISLISVYSFTSINHTLFSYDTLVSLKEFHSNILDFYSLDLSKSNVSTLFAGTIKGKFSVLSLNDNILNSFEVNSFSNLSFLTELSFSKNLIHALNFQHAFQYSLKNLTKIDFSSNKISSIDSRFFQKFPNLISLDLSDNNFYSILRDNFLNLSKLEQLKLSENQILTIELGSFDALKQLKILDLKNNLIYELNNNNLFRNLKALKELNICKNKLESIKKFDFNGLSSLILLDLSENQLKILDENVFELMPQLESLTLKSNQINFFSNSFAYLVKLKHLYLSSNNLAYLNITPVFSKILSLDLSENSLKKVSSFFSLKNVRYLNLSRTNSIFVHELLNISYKSVSLVELDLSFNNLNNFNGFSNFMGLKKLFLKETNLVNFEFLENFPKLTDLDLSNNILYGSSNNKFLSNELRVLKLSNVSLQSIDYFPNLKSLGYLDLSYNNLITIAFGNTNIFYLDVSFNNIKSLYGAIESVFRHLMDSAAFLRHFNLANSLNSVLKDNIFYFNKQLEIVFFTGNNLNLFPKFCQFCSSDSCRSNLLINNECRLRHLYFDSNNLKALLFADLSALDNLELLNLDNNSLSFIEEKSLSNLIKLEVLILSRNKLSSMNLNTILFSKLSNLKLLNLSSNLIESIYSKVFSQLYKLETLDLSFNKIYILYEFSLNNLISLRNLQLNDNHKTILFELKSLFNLESIQNVFISQSILTRQNKDGDLMNSIFINLFKTKNLKFSKSVLKRAYFKSLFLISTYGTYNCELSLFFMRNNVHFNFKTEKDIFDYFNECSQIVIKESLNLNSKKSQTISYIFTNGFFYFAWMVLLFITTIGLYLGLNKTTPKRRKSLMNFVHSNELLVEDVIELETIVDEQAHT
jgi:Leucine-rich repeat (LRR) protein